jgi:hypothetical protein
MTAYELRLFHIRGSQAYNDESRKWISRIWVATLLGCVNRVLRAPQSTSSIFDNNFHKP